MRDDYLIAVDSDGCVFDTMELKHKECFIPMIIKHYGLQAVSKYARETAEFVNLYSRHRGINRFPGLVLTLEMLAARPEVQARGRRVEVPSSLAEWCRSSKQLSNPALRERLAVQPDASLQQALEWSLEVNRMIDEMVHDVPPFPLVRECLTTAAATAEIIVCSATPTVALEKEWAEHDLRRWVATICGQEQGTKSEILGRATEYRPGHVLMIGDAPGDQRAAVANGCAFFPINPGAEAESWAELAEQGLPRFFAGRFSGEYQKALITAFEARLPVNPPW